ncbi:MAG: Holliday junction resolvase RuvX [Rubrobacteraceae bacterium]|jgi:putative Holliday junction resolvase
MSKAVVATGKIAALDLGEVRTGVAISDAGRTLARPVEVVASGEIEDYLHRMIVEESVVEIVVGVPKTMRGEVGFQARRILGKIDALEDMFPNIAFVRWDERLTTRIAASGGGGKKSKKGVRRLDHLAAATMLQEYLDRGAREGV